MANKKKCLICGKLYSYCNTCYEDRFKPAWYQIFCSEECKEIDGIFSENTLGMITDIEAKHRLEELDLSGKEFYKQRVQDKINYFLSLEEPEKEVEEIKEDDNEENTNEILIEEKAQYENIKSKLNKKRYSKNKNSNNK